MKIIIGLFYLKNCKFALKIFYMSNKKENIQIPLDQIPADGALGLLALGDVGVKLWRDARQKKIKEVNLNKASVKNEQKES
jgi:hypothetical protein